MRRHHNPYNNLDNFGAVLAAAFYLKIQRRKIITGPTTGDFDFIDEAL